MVDPVPRPTRPPARPPPLQIPQLEVWFQRASDVVRKLRYGDIDLGIVGYDMFSELADEDPNLLVVRGPGHAALRQLAGTGRRPGAAAWRAAAVISPPTPTPHPSPVLWRLASGGRGLLPGGTCARCGALSVPTAPRARPPLAPAWPSIWLPPPPAPPPATHLHTHSPPSHTPRPKVHDALDFGKCHLALGVPMTGKFASIDSLDQLRAMPWSEDAPLRVVTGELEGQEARPSGPVACAKLARVSAGPCSCPAVAARCPPLAGLHPLEHTQLQGAAACAGRLTGSCAKHARLRPAPSTRAHPHPCPCPRPARLQATTTSRAATLRSRASSTWCC
jgi:hypothetical protein